MLKRIERVLLMVVVIMMLSTSCNSGGNKSERNKEHEKSFSDQLHLSHKEKLGKKVFDSNGCFACHQANQKLVGPSLADVANVYAGKSDHLVEFFEGKRKSIIDPSQEVLMRSSLELTKKMPPAEREALVDYILAHQ